MFKPNEKEIAQIVINMFIRGGHCYGSRVNEINYLSVQREMYIVVSHLKLKHSMHLGIYTTEERSWLKQLISLDRHCH